MDTTPCDSYKQAMAAASAKSSLYDLWDALPSELDPAQWEEQYDKIEKGEKVFFF